jgi:hypothetical protein
MVSSFGRPRDPEPELPELELDPQGVPFPTIHLPCVPVINEAALRALAATIHEHVANAVRSGFAEGFADVTSDLDSDPDGDADCADSDASEVGR